MRLRPLGWELILFLVVLGILVGGLATGSTALIGVSIVACAVAAPVVIVSFVVRLVAGILDDARRRRVFRALT